MRRKWILFSVLILVLLALMLAAAVIIANLASRNVSLLETTPFRELGIIGKFMATEFPTSAYQLISLIITLYILSFTFTFRRNLSLSERYSNISVLFHKEYLDREMDKELTYDAAHKPTKKIEVVRDYVRSRHSDPNFLSEFRENSINFAMWQYDFVEEICHGLQDAGVAAISGAIPLRLVLSDAAHVIVEDWKYAKDYLENWREKSAERVHATGSPSVLWSRRHGEWLVCVAAIYLWVYWDCAGTRKLMSDPRLQLKYCLHREEELRQNEWDLSPPQVIAEIRDLRGRAWWRSLDANWSYWFHKCLNRNPCSSWGRIVTSVYRQLNLM